MTTATVEKVLEHHRYDDSMLIGILQDIQRSYNYLPEEAIREVARRFEIPFTRVYGIATFYKAFSLKPRGKHIIQACLGTACHVRGASRIADFISRKLEIKPGDTTDDLLFTFETVNCLGACALGPVIVADGEYHGQMTTKKMDALLKKLLSGSPTTSVQSSSRDAL